MFEEHLSKLDVNCGNLAPKQAQTYHTLRLAAFFIKRDDFFMKLPEFMQEAGMPHQTSWLMIPTERQTMVPNFWSNPGRSPFNHHSFQSVTEVLNLRCLPKNNFF